MFNNSQHFVVQPPKDSIQVAHQILWIAYQQGKVFTSMQLLKLVYISHGWMLAIHGQSLFRASVEAWKYGPVEPLVYKKFKKFGRNHIDGSFKNFSHCFDKDELDIMEQVVAIYGDYTGIQLSSLTHQPDSPWATTVEILGENSAISSDLIKQHYRGLLESNSLTA